MTEKKVVLSWEEWELLKNKADEALICTINHFFYGGKTLEFNKKEEFLNGLSKEIESKSKRLELSEHNLDVYESVIKNYEQESIVDFLKRKLKK